MLKKSSNLNKKSSNKPKDDIEDGSIHSDIIHNLTTTLGSGALHGKVLLVTSLAWI